MLVLVTSSGHATSLYFPTIEQDLEVDRALLGSLYRKDSSAYQISTKHLLRSVEAR
jgi:hypothetical protein